MNLKLLTLFCLVIVWTGFSSVITAADAAPTTPPIRTDADIVAAQQLMAGYSERAARAYAAPRDVSHEITPQSIRVGYTGYIHCSDWLNAGQPIVKVVEMPFADYVKQVLPNEWPNAWHAESLKAGAVAVKNFGWWKITLRGTPWQRPGGADVVNNTCDQYFVEGSYRPTTDAAVDQTWGWRLSRNNRIIATNFLDRSWRCDDYGWPDCMGQWDSKELAEQGMPFDQILHYFYDPIDLNLVNTPVAAVNVISNGSFGSGMANWWLWGGVGQSDTHNGVMRFYRGQNTTDPAVLLQDVDTVLYTASPMAVQLNLGNSSGRTKRVSVHLHDTQSWTNPISCGFTLAPNTPLLPFIVRGISQQAWSGIRLEIVAEDADGAGYLLVDDVQVSYRPGMPTTNYGCFLPKPAAPTVSAPANNALVKTDFTLALTAGRSNYRVGGTQQYRVQIAADSTFAAPVYDNLNNLTTQTSIPMSLPVGDYHVRARQFDGIDLWGPWSAAQTFRVRAFPDKPVLQAPLGSVDGAGLTFTWTHGANTEFYRVFVNRVDNNAIIARGDFTPAAAACASVCTLTPAQLGFVALDNVEYKWVVRAFNGDVIVGSGWQKFKADMPGVPQNLIPVNGAVVDNITLRWNRVLDATRYRIVIKNGPGTKVLLNTVAEASALCDSDDCAFNAQASGLPVGDGRRYQWNVRAIRATPWAVSNSPWQTFTYYGPRPTPTSEDFVYTLTPTNTPTRTITPTPTNTPSVP